MPPRLFPRVSGRTSARVRAPSPPCVALTACCRPAPLQLASTEEWIDGQFSGNLGEILIRCNNVLYLRGVPEEDE